jgi:hypothetical protein
MKKLLKKWGQKRLQVAMKNEPEKAINLKKSFNQARLYCGTIYRGLV